MIWDTVLSCSWPDFTWCYAKRIWRQDRLKMRYILSFYKFLHSTFRFSQCSLEAVTSFCLWDCSLFTPALFTMTLLPNHLTFLGVRGSTRTSNYSFFFFCKFPSFPVKPNSTLGLIKRVRHTNICIWSYHRR